MALLGQSSEATVSLVLIYVTVNIHWWPIETRLQKRFLLQCNAMLSNAMQCNAKQCNAKQCNAKQCNAKQCNAKQCNAKQCNAKQC